MKRSLKILSTVLLILVIISLSAVTALWLFFPAEYVRTELTRELSDRFNHDITIDNLAVRVFPNLELTAQNVRVLDPPSSREVLSAKQVRFDLNVWELFKRRVVIQTITINAPRLDLTRDDRGKWNLENLTESLRSGEEVSETSESVNRIEFGNVSVENGFVKVNDQSLGQQLKVSNLTASLDFREECLAVDSASIALPPVKAEVAGTITGLSKPSPLLDLTATLEITKEGPLRDLVSLNVPVGTKIADSSLDLTGPIKEIKCTTTFSLDQLAAADFTTEGTIQGTLQPEKGLFTADAITLNFENNTLSLSGSISDIWTNNRRANLKGTASIPFEETVAFTWIDTLSNLDLKGVVNASIALAASAELLDLKTTIDLQDTDFTVPHLMHKQRGERATLALDTRYTLPEKIIIDTFELIFEKDKITGSARVQTGTDSSFQVSLTTPSFSLAHLNQIPVVGFQEGSAGFSAKVWKSKSSSEGIQYSGDLRLDNATLTVKPMNEPFKELNARIKVEGQKVDITTASFLFGESRYRLQAEISDLTSPRICGKLHGDVLDVNRLIAAFKKPKDAPREKTSSFPTKGPDFSLEMAVEADELLLNKYRAGAVSTTWHTTGRVQRFDPVQIAAFGGTLGGTFELSVMKGGTTWTTHFKGQSIRLETLWPQLVGAESKTRVKGNLSAEGALSGGPSSKQEGMWKTLNGQVALTATDTTFLQSSMFRSLLLAAAGPVGTLFNILTLQSRSFDVNSMFFKTVDGTFQVANGRAHTEDTCFDGSSVDFRFTGDIDLVENNYNMSAQAIPLSTIGTLMDKVPVVGKHLDRAKNTVLSYRFKVTGPLTKPTAELESTEEVEVEEKKPEP
jgi:uncharacterized protein involved in outer membrane biogenesis